MTNSPTSRWAGARNSTIFSQTNLFLDHLIFLEWDFRCSAMSNHKKLIDATVSFLLVTGSWCSTIFRHGHFDFWKTVFSCVFLLTLCLHIAQYLRVVESPLKYYAFCNGPLANFAKTKERNRVEVEMTSLEFPLYEHVQKNVSLSYQPRLWICSFVVTKFESDQFILFCFSGNIFVKTLLREKHLGCGKHLAKSRDIVALKLIWEKCWRDK